MQLQGRTAVVTGAAGGIGRAMCIMLAERGVATVVGLDVDADRLDETRKLVEQASAGTRVQTAVVDVSDAQAVRSALAEALGDAEVHFLFNIAGIIRAKPVLDSTTEDLLELMRVNVASVVTMTAAVVPKMPEGGVVINTSSSAADHISHGLGLYGSSKLAIIHVTKALAQECADRGVRVSAVAPGAILTPMPLNLPKDQGDPEAVLRDAANATQLIQRLGQPEEVAGLMCFLAGPEGEFFTGTTIRIDGGSEAK